LGGTKLTETLAGILSARRIEPGIEVRIGQHFVLLKRDLEDHAISASHSRRWTIRPRGLDFAAARATIRIADKGVLNIDATQSGMRVKTAILGAESRSLIDARRSQNEIQAVAISGQCAA
jgi:hypothetical protein